MKLLIFCAYILVTAFSFSQVEIDPLKNVETNDLGNARLVDKKGNPATPFVFIRLQYVGKNLYIFTADARFRGELKNMIAANSDDKTKRVFNEDEFEEQMDMEIFDEANIFKGIISSKGVLISGETFRMVNFLFGTEKNPMFAAQDQEEFELNQKGNFALISKKGEVLTPFEFEFIGSENGDIKGAKIDEENNLTFVFYDKKGKEIRE